MNNRIDANEVATEAETAFHEAVRVFNAAKKVDSETVTLSRRSLYLLLVLAADDVGMVIQDASAES